MSDLLRMTGMYSGMDTESVIQSLVSAKAQKVTTLKNDQKKLQWKQDTWQKLNTKLYSLYSKTLSNLRFSSSYAKKKTKVSDATKASIVADSGAVNGTQTLEVKQLAKSGYLTGAVVSKQIPKVTKDTTLSDLGAKGGEVFITVDGNKSSTGISYAANDTIDSFITRFNNSAEAAAADVKMQFEDGKITITGASGGDPAGGQTFGLSTENSAGQSIVAALGLSDCTPSDNVSGEFTGSKIRVPGVDYHDEASVKLKDLNIKNGKIRVQTMGKDASGNNEWQDFEIDVDEDMTVEQFIKKFNQENADRGTQLSMSVENGRISVERPDDDGYTYTLSSSADKAGKTLLQGFGLSDIGSNPQGGKVTGLMVSKLNPAVVTDEFKLDTKLSAIDPTLIGQKIVLTVGKGAGATQTDIEITSEMKVSDLVNKLREGGVNASFDEKNQRFFISSTGTGEAKEFSLEATGGALKSLGLDPDAVYENGSQASRINAEDAIIILNDAEFTSDTNTFAINGLSITAQAVTDEPITITTDTDYDGIYDMIKDFITEYNEIMNEMNKLYSADSARKYDMLTDEQKESMSDDEVEQWEDTIKGALLRRDGTLYSVMNSMREAINGKYTVNGQDMFLKNLGIGTGSYFRTTKEDRYALHIDGDPDDELTSSEKDRLKAALAEDPESVIELFSQMAKKMYDSLHDAMGSTLYSSIYKVYDDKQMKKDYDDYTTKIKEAEKKLSAYEDKWYKKFSAMEVALSKLQSSQNTISSMLGQ